MDSTVRACRRGAAGRVATCGAARASRPRRGSGSRARVIRSGAARGCA